jgi:rfaE bifunctional protein nucleotidyltransferase chain/domain
LHAAFRPWYFFPMTAWTPRHKLADWPTLLAARDRARADGRTVVWTNGCFDLLHPGHLASLAAARQLGDVLVVGLNSDASVQVNKGPLRPILSEAERAAMLAAVECVDYVIVFDEQTPEAALAKLKPDIHCKGAEYAPPHGRPVPERAVVEGYGGRVAYLPLVPGLSTTDLIARVRAKTEINRAA